MSSFIRILRKCFVVASSVMTIACHGALIWDGPSITYSQPAFDPTQATNQDRLTPNVWLTRGISQGLFNAASETQAGQFSPSDTEWAFGTADQYSMLQFTNWLSWLNGASPTNLVGKQVVAHLVSEDIYVSMKFTFWGSKGAGGFAYIRSTPPLNPVIWNFNGTGFNYSTIATSNYVVETSSDLSNWSALSTNVAVSTVSQVQDTSNSPMRFYRIKQIAP